MSTQKPKPIQEPSQKIELINQTLTRGVVEVLPNKDSLAKLMTKRRIKLYLGIDPTGATLHLGHAVVLRKLQQFADLGHEVILLIGSGTVKIGDPTDRDESRPMLTDKEIEENFQNWKQQAKTILDFSTIKIMRNGDWLDKMTLPDIIKLSAKTTVQQLLERDMFQERMKQGTPIHGHEILYPLLQGYDSVVMNVDLEIGGTDQTFNMLMGRTLQKIYHNKEKWVLTTPIIEGTDGRKMSKSYGNFVALTEEPTQMYGKLMSIKDELILDYLTLLTDLPLAEIDEIKANMQQGDNPLQFKKRMAHTITANLHNKQKADQAQQYFERTVQNNELPEEMPVLKLSSKKIMVLELLKMCQPNESNSNLKRLSKQGAVRLLPQEVQLDDYQQEVELETDQVIKIGKRKYYKIKLQ